MNLANYYGPPRDMGEIDAPVTDMGEIDAPVATPSWDAEAAAPSAPTALTALRDAPTPPVAVPADYYGPVRDMGELDAPAAPPPAAPPEQAIGFQIPASAPRTAGQPAPTRPAGPPPGPSEMSKANKAFRASYDVDKAATQEGAHTEEMRADLMAQRQQELAQQKQEAAEQAAVKAADEAKRIQDYQAETQRQIDDVRAQKIQPNRAYSDSGSAAMAIFGGVLGGLYQGLNKLSSNPFIDQMNRVMDRDIDAQKADLATKKEGIADRKSLLAEMRATYKDEALAIAQAKNLYLEGAKEHLAAEAATYDSPAIQSRADLAINALSREQTKLDLQRLQQEAAQRAAAAHAAEHQRQVDFENRLKLHGAQLEERKVGVEEQKAINEAGKKDEAQTAALSKELSDPKLVEARRTIDDLKPKVMRGVNPTTGAAEYDNKTRIPGTGQGADTREALFPGQPSLASNLIPGYGAAHYVGKLSDEERIGRLEWNRLFDAYRVAVTGAGAGEGELVRLEKSFHGANTPAEQQAAIRLADEALRAREDRIKAGVSPEIARKYDARVKQETGARPGTVQREPVR
jgi:hypothetical protein